MADHATGGRPLKSPAEGRREKFACRLSEAMRDRLGTEANLVGRSLSEEMEARLIDSFRAPDLRQILREELSGMPAKAWKPIDVAPKDRKIDLWAKMWLADGDRFTSERFPDCRYDAGDSMGNRGPSWSGLPQGWHPTHWMDRPEGPAPSDG